MVRFCAICLIKHSEVSKLPVFDYSARDNQGRTVAGTLDAASDRDVARTLRERGLLPQHIREVSRRGESSSFGELLARAFLVPSLASRMFLLRQLATMLHAGMPMGQAIASIADRTRNRRLRAVLLDAQQHVMSGGPLSEALARHSWAFGALEMALIKSGELAGGMDKSAAQAADYLEREIEVRRKFSRATFYPKMLVLACVFIPPLPVLILGSPEAYLRIIFHTTLPIMIVAGIVWAVLRVALQSPPVAEAWDTVKLAIPGIGGNVRKFALAKFARATAVLYAAGAPAAECVEVAAAASGNRYIGGRMARTAGAVRDGQDLHSALSQSKVLTPLVEQMLATGQMTGDVDAMLNKVAEYYEAEAEAGMDRLAVIVGIVAFLAVAFYIGAIVVAGYSKIGSAYNGAGN